MFKLRKGSIVSAEVWSILWALKLGWEWKLATLIIESDCQEVLELIGSGDRGITRIQAHFGRSNRCWNVRGWWSSLFVVMRQIGSPTHSQRELLVYMLTFSSFPMECIAELLRLEKPTFEKLAVVFLSFIYKKRYDV